MDADTALEALTVEELVKNEDVKSVLENEEVVLADDLTHVDDANPAMTMNDMPMLDNSQIIPEVEVTNIELVAEEIDVEPIPNASDLIPIADTSNELLENSAELDETTIDNLTDLTEANSELIITTPDAETHPLEIDKSIAEVPESNDSSEILEPISFNDELQESVLPAEDYQVNASVIEAESAVAQIIIPEHVDESEILVENDLTFSVDQQQDVIATSFTDELNSSSEYMVLNENLSEPISVNGLHQLSKDEPIPDDLYQTEPVIKPDIETSFASDLPAEDAVTEMAFSSIQMDDEAVIEEQDTAVISPDEQMILMHDEVYDQAESNVLEPEPVDDNDGDEDEDEKKPLNIPCHVLGRNVENPLEDPVRNGRVLLKPRLGVKIPYRNLTSQIVSKQEIAEEIMERSRIRQSSAEPPAGGDVFFAKKLTQRLAKKLVPGAKSGKSSSSGKTSTSTSSSSNKKVPKLEPMTSAKVQGAPVVVAQVEVKQPSSKMPVPTSNSSTKATSNMSGKITDNSDLIALLEGDDDPDWSIDVKSVAAPNRSVDWERETALKQLRELPKQSKGIIKSVKDAPVLSPPASAPPTAPIVEKDPLEIENKKDPLEGSPKKEATEEKDDNIQPRFSSNTVMKTYTRKRKPYEDIKTAFSPPSPKKSTASNEQKQQKQPPALTPIKQASSKPPVLTPQKSSASSQKSSSSTTVQKSSVSKISSIPTLHKSSSATNLLKATPYVMVQNISAMSNLQKPKPETESTKRPVEKKLPVTPAKPKPSEPTKKTLSPNTYISKSSRIVKKKKIWDPDEATPPAKLVSVKSPKPMDSPRTGTDKPPTPVEKKIKPTEAPAKPKLVKTVLKPSNDKSPKKQLVGVKKIMVKKKPKRLTEVDRLLMDEGAVNLLYSVNKNTEELQTMNKKKKKKALISLEKAQRDLLNKTNEIRNDLQINNTNNSPMSLRKKDGTVSKSSPFKELAATVLHRKKSKDSMSGSVHSPPASPGFAYTQHAEASRIIRRHSSSSFSSETSEGNAEKTTNKHKTNEPQKKRAKVHHEKHVRSSIGVDKQLLNEEMSRNFNKVPADDPKYLNFQTFSVRKFDNLVQIILAPTTSNGQTTLSLQVLTELAEVFHVIQNDNTCRVAVISSAGNSFCQGIDYKDLASEDQATQQDAAEKYTDAVREFLTALAKFSKLLVAGVHGNTVGLGVTMLPLFDMVLASDTATFSTPYAQLGCAAEGGVLLTLPHVMHNALASELFFASRKLTAAEALRLGLVTRTLWPDKFQEELISALKVISGQSLQSMQAIKKQLRHHLLQDVEASLKSESSTLIEHWTGSECQRNFKAYSLESK